MRRPIPISRAASLIPISRISLLVAAAAAGLAFHAASASVRSPVRDTVLVPETVDGRVPLLVRASPGAKAALAARALEFGGTVTHEFANLDAIWVAIPKEALALFAADARIANVERPRFVRRAIVPATPPAALARGTPRPGDPRDELAGLEHSEGARVQTVALESLSRGSDPTSFFGYDVITGAAEAWEVAGHGEGVVVAIVDTGIYPDHPMIAGNVIGGINLVPSEEEEAIDADGNGTPEGLSFDWNAIENDGHGTFCAGMVAGHADVEFPLDHRLVASLLVHSPESVEVGSKSATVRLRGVAPGASLYAVKVFPYDGGGAPDARVAEAIDRLITLKRSGEIDIDVISMSLSGPVLFDGFNALDAIVDVATSFGITCVSAASNEGPSLVSVGSPGSAVSSITVGATLDPLHTRVAAEVLFGLPIGSGAVLDPYDDPMMIEFSSRGLTADRRVKPDLVATGFLVYSSGLRDANLDGVNDSAAFGFGSGTSFSTPTVAGAAALVTAYGDELGGLGRAPFVGNVLKKAAVPIAKKSAVSEREQGRGFIHIPGALTLLANGAYLSPGEADPTHTTKERASLAASGAFGTTPDIGPGESYNVLLDVPSDVHKIVFEFPSVALSPNANPIFGESLGAVIHSAKRGGSGDYVFAAEGLDGGVEAGTVFELFHPEPGTLRLTFTGTAFNYGPASASWSARAVRAVALPSKIVSGAIHQGEIIEHEVMIPSGLDAVGIRLRWNHDWTRFPTFDLDMAVTTPAGPFPMATIDSPEFALIEDPPGGAWSFRITDLGTALGPEEYELKLVYGVQTLLGGEKPVDPPARIVGVAPNPSRGSTDIELSMPWAGPARVRVLDVAGREVCTIADRTLEEGAHRLRWDGANDSGDAVAPGVYFVRVETRGGSTVRKIAILE
jgi:subtilisin family serine protease